MKDENEYFNMIFEFWKTHEVSWREIMYYNNTKMLEFFNMLESE